MTGRRLRITILLLLLATIICSFSVVSVEAQQNQETGSQHGATTTSFAPAGPTSNTNSVDETNASTHAATGPALKGTDSSHEPAGSGHEASGSGHEASGSGHEAKPAHEAPTFMMFMGPAVAGVLAIVLIGCVIAFKNRKGK